MENGTTISNNLSADWVDQWFETPIRVSQTKQRYLWTKERHVGHKTPKATPIMPHEMQIGEAQRCTSNLMPNSKREERQIENADSQVEFKQRSQEFKPQQKIVLGSTNLMQQHNFDTLIQEEK